MPGGVGHPHLVLAGVATHRVTFVEGGQALGAQARRGGFDLLARVDADAQMVEPGARRLLQGERHGRVGELELGVVRLLLRRLHTEELAVERDGLLEIGDVQRKMECIHDCLYREISIECQA
jgi:hypothetical protein